MTDLPILFSAPMVRALLDGRKHQTRRLLTRNNATVLGHSWRGKSCPWEGLRFAEAVVRTKSPMSGCPDPLLAVPFCHPADEPTASEDCGIYAVRPVVEVGDRLWVREAWRCNGWASDVATIFYRASEGDGCTAMCEQWPVADHKPLRVETKWSPSLHLPRWASRLTLTVTDVRVQRLQECSAEDCAAEGACDSGVDFNNAQRAYRDIWEAINGLNSWLQNPWIVALTFTVERRNIDAPRAA